MKKTITITNINPNSLLMDVRFEYENRFIDMSVPIPMTSNNTIIESVEDIKLMLSAMYPVHELGCRVEEQNNLESPIEINKEIQSLVDVGFECIENAQEKLNDSINENPEDELRNYILNMYGDEANVTAIRHIVMNLLEELKLIK